MALSSSTLSNMMVAELQAQEFVTSGEHAKAKKMCDALAKAIVDHIKASAQVPVTGGSSSGKYQVT